MTSSYSYAIGEYDVRLIRATMEAYPCELKTNNERFLVYSETALDNAALFSTMIRGAIGRVRLVGCNKQSALHHQITFDNLEFG